MNIDELVESIPEEDIRADLKQLVREWKADATDVNHLGELLVGWQEKTYFKDQEARGQFYKRFKVFQAKAIDEIGGMTMNERLYWFGLFEEWDAADQNGKERVRGKLQAPS